jgi:hypothetical protein
VVKIRIAGKMAIQSVPGKNRIPPGKDRALILTDPYCMLDRLINVAKEVFSGYYDPIAKPPACSSFSSG